MNESIYQNIFEKIQDYLPDEWNRMAFYVGYTEGSYSMKFYVDDGDGYIDCFKLYSKSKLIKLFITIDKIISSERNKLKAENKWTVLGMFVDSSGNFKSNLDYVDISDNSIEYENLWKKKYL